MELKIITTILAEIARFFSCGALWCALMQLGNATFGAMQTTYVIPPTTMARNPVHDAGATDDGTFVVAVALPSGHDRTFHREIAKIGREGLDEPVRVSIPLTPRSSWVIESESDGFFVTETAWWYATLDDRAVDGCFTECKSLATTFVKSDGSRVTHVRPPVAIDASRLWQTIVIPGEEPRALEFAYFPDVTIAREVEWSGKSKSWRLPPVDPKHPGRRVAEPLPDGRIALLSNSSGISLYLLSADGGVEAVPLRNLRIEAFDAAVDGAGRIAIVAARNAIATAPKDTGTIDVAIVDPAHPDRAEWSPLRHDVRVTGHHRQVQVVATPGGFAAAWINEADRRRIEAAEIDRRGHGGTVVAVGEPSSGTMMPFLRLQRRQDELLFWWDDGVHLIQRRLPGSLEGYALIDDLARRFCGETDASHH
jgi:hypothetical protein